MFEIYATMVMMLFGVVWVKDNWLNVFIKLVFLGGGMWGAIEIGYNYGYIVRVG